MAVVYYPYPTPYFNRNVYQQGPYPPWMAQPAYTYKGLSEMKYSQLAYYPAPMLNPYPLMMTEPAMSYGQLSAWYPLTMDPMPMMPMPAMSVGQPFYSQPQWFQPAPMFTWY